jgi:hypothetical protein
MPIPARALLTALLVFGTCGAADLETAKEISDCVRANSPERTSMQFVELESQDRSGHTKTMDAQLRWKKHDDGHVRLLIRILGPQDLKGSSYLVIENQPRDTVYTYLPALGKPRRIVGGGSKDIWGTDFSYEDIRLLQMKDNASQDERLDDAVFAGKPTYVIAQRPDPAQESAYTRIVSFIDKDTCVVMKTEYYETEDQIRKRLVADPESVSRVSDLWTAHELEMTDLHEDTRSWLRIKKITYDEEMSSRYFNTVQFWGN